METQKNLGIWMDHATADLIDINTSTNSQRIVSDFTFEDKEDTLTKSEKIMHNKQMQRQEEYYKQIADVILNYQQVVLFGSTDAKVELYNYLRSDLHFKDIKIDIKETDQMTNNEKTAFVEKHFK